MRLVEWMGHVRTEPGDVRSVNMCVCVCGCLGVCLGFSGLPQRYVGVLFSISLLLSLFRSPYSIGFDTILNPRQQWTYRKAWVIAGDTNKNKNTKKKRKTRKNNVCDMKKDFSRGARHWRNRQAHRHHPRGHFYISFCPQPEHLFDQQTGKQSEQGAQNDVSVTRTFSSCTFPFGFNPCPQAPSPCQPTEGTYILNWEFHMNVQLSTMRHPTIFNWNTWPSIGFSCRAFVFVFSSAAFFPLFFPFFCFNFN